MLNLNESDHQELDRLIAAAVGRVRDEAAGAPDTDTDIDSISRQANGILKREQEERGT